MPNDNNYIMAGGHYLVMAKDGKLFAGKVLIRSGNTFYLSGAVIVHYRSWGGSIPDIANWECGPTPLTTTAKINEVAVFDAHWTIRCEDAAIDGLGIR